jgi:tungstate transport system permease protein
MPDSSTVTEIIWTSLRVSGAALLLSTIAGVPLGILLAMRRFPLRGLAIALTYTGMAFPPVVIGLCVYVLISRTGPIGSLNLPFVPSLFTIEAMVLAQTVLALPLVIGFTMSALLGLDPGLRNQLRALGASERQIAWQLLREARSGIVLALVGGFGAIISEVGAVQLVGGNIASKTRTLTTAIVLETNKGEFALALTLGGILLAIAFVTNVIALRLQGRSIGG